MTAVHNHLVREGTRTQVALIIESGEPREVMHYCAAHRLWRQRDQSLSGHRDAGRSWRCAAICPNGVTFEKALKNYNKAVNKGLLKVFSKMGISTLQSYRGAQVFEAIGLNKALVDQYFTGTASRIEGVGLDVLAREAQMKHEHAFRPLAGLRTELTVGGNYQYRVRGEYHLLNPHTVSKLQHAVRQASFQTFQEYTELINEQSRQLCTLRGLMEFKLAAKPVPLEEVEPASEIVKRFATGAMSFGSISKEAHETLAIAMNRIGGKSNTGEGGEDEARFQRDANGDWRRSAIKQVASARFGVTTNYLVNADELQIKMAQGAKPGEGGQLPGHKVDEVIARVRHSIPGVQLDFAAAASRHLLDRGSGAAHLRPEERQSPGAHFGEAGGRSGRGHGGRGRGQGACRRGAHQRPRWRHGRFAAHFHQARRRSLGTGPRRDPAGAGVERSAQPHPRADRWQTADRPRRRHRRVCLEPRSSDSPPRRWFRWAAS